MKKTIVLLSLLVSCFASRATNFTFVLATTDTAVSHWILAVNQVDSDLAHIAALGARPTPPLYDSTAAQWATFAAAAFTYDSAQASYANAYNSDILIQSNDALNILTSLGYNSVYTNTLVNQWVKVSGNNFSTSWIGVNTNTSYSLCTGCTVMPYLTIVSIQPTKSFPGK